MTQEVTLVKRFPYLTAGERAFLCAALNHARFYEKNLMKYPEIHQGLLPFIPLNAVIYVLEDYYVSDDREEPWPTYRQCHIDLINKWKLASALHVLEDYTKSEDS